MQGRIIKWDDEKGFGFIQSPEVTENIFVHASSFVDKRIRPAVGDDIAFELKRTDKGLQAKKVDYPNKSEQFLSSPRSPTRQSNVRPSNSSVTPSIIKLIVLCGVLFGGYQVYQKYRPQLVALILYCCKMQQSAQVFLSRSRHSYRYG